MVAGAAIGYGARMADRAPQLPSRFAVVTGDVACDWPQPPTGSIELRGARLLHWRPATEVAQGRAVGVFDGVLLNSEELRRRLTVRGVAAGPLDSAQLALEWLAAFGPNAVGDLRWHGALALLHRAQGAVLLARDLVGVGWLGQARVGTSSVWTSDPRPLAQAQRAAPPGWVGIASAAGLQQPKVGYAAENALYLREIPDAARHATAQSGLAHANHLLSNAIAAHAETLGGLDASALVGVALDAPEPVPTGPALWSPVGVRGWCDPGAQVCERAADLRDDGPHEPVTVADAADAAERRWRWRTLPDGPMRAARVAALNAGRVLCAPHLDPAIVAWLGALPRSVRPAWLGTGDPDRDAAPERSDG